MRTKFVFLLLVGMFSLVASVHAIENSDTSNVITSPKQARHLIIPFIGYQALNGEEVGYFYSRDYLDPNGASYDSVHVERSGSAERNVTSPELGIVYRYMPMDLIQAELSMSMIHDKTHFEYPVRYERRGYTERRQVNVERKQTVLSTMSLIVNVPDVWDWLKTSFKLTGGYAWREFVIEEGWTQEISGVTDSKEMYVGRAGVDLSYWAGKSFLMETSIYYTAFIPTTGDNAIFGGVGWKVSVFPFWSGVRSNR